MGERASKTAALGTFRSLRALRVLNVAAVGSSLAGATGAFMLQIMGNNSHSDRTFSVASAVTTLVFGVAWAALLRSKKKVSGTPMRWGWIASIPLAIGNAATACGLLMVADAGHEIWIDKFLKGALLGATFGAIIWLPALIMTLVAFGLPILWAQTRAEKGLAGEERGEVVIGLVSAFIGLGSILLLLESVTGAAILIGLMALLGVISGGVASASALRRESVRRGFVKAVEDGVVEGFRVDQTAEGKALVRVTSMGSGYRVANFEEHLVDLDETGAARRGSV